MSNPKEPGPGPFQGQFSIDVYAVFSDFCNCKNSQAENRISHQHSGVISKSVVLVISLPFLHSFFAHGFQK